MKKVEKKPLPQASPGTQRVLDVISYGKPGARPKAYLQAGLHADEAPGYLVLHHLIELLDKADADDRISGEIILVPAANPIGLSQWWNEMLQGRFDLSNSINFNRQHHDVISRLIDRVGPRLSDDSAANVAVIRAAVSEILAEIVPEDEAEHLKLLLLKRSHDADIVLDLHCDLQALMHVYIGTPLWPDAEDLSAQLGAESTLLAADSGGGPFDEANGRPWWALAEHFPKYPIPPACLAATVELRGISDTDPETVSQDADNLFTFLQRRGLIDGSAPALPLLPNPATPLTGVDYVQAQSPGILMYEKKIGDWVKEGDVIARVVNPLPDDNTQRVIEIKSRTDGLLFSTNVDRFSRPGRIIAKVAGTKSLVADEGDLLTL